MDRWSRGWRVGWRVVGQRQNPTFGSPLFSRHVQAGCGLWSFVIVIGVVTIILNHYYDNNYYFFPIPPPRHHHQQQQQQHHHHQHQHQHNNNHHHRYWFMIRLDKKTYGLHLHHLNPTLDARKLGYQVRFYDEMLTFVASMLNLGGLCFGVYLNKTRQLLQLLEAFDWRTAAAIWTALVLCQRGARL